MRKWILSFYNDLKSVFTLVNLVNEYEIEVWFVSLCY